jgi:hypothetical protein
VENDGGQPAKRGRPKNKHKPVEVPITATPKLAAYLEALIDAEGYGNTRAEVARTLCWRMVEQLIRDGILTKIHGEPPEEARVTGGQ